MRSSFITLTVNVALLDIANAPPAFYTVVVPISVHVESLVEGVQRRGG